MIPLPAQSLLGSATLIILVLAVRARIGRIFSPGAAYSLWALPALRLLLPPLPSLSHVMLRATPFRAVRFTAAEGHGGGMIVGQIINATGAIPWHIVADLWLAGSLLWLGLQMLRYCRFIRGALAGAVKLSDSEGVTILLSRGVDGPVATGIFRRRIFLPADFGSRYGTLERRLAIQHERSHHRRHDLIANFAAIAVLAAHWWNPIAHWAYRRFRGDQELACDASVLVTLSNDERRGYATALLKSAMCPVPMVCALSHVDELKGRIAALHRPPMSRARFFSASAFVLLLACLGLASTAAVGGLVPPEPLKRAPSVAFAKPPSDAVLARAEKEPSRIETLIPRAARTRRHIGPSQQARSLPAVPSPDSPHDEYAAAPTAELFRQIWPQGGDTSIVAAEDHDLIAVAIARAEGDNHAPSSRSAVRFLILRSRTPDDLGIFKQVIGQT